MIDRPADPRLAEAFSLLREVLEEEGRNGGHAVPAASASAGWGGPAAEGPAIAGTGLAGSAAAGSGFLSSDILALWQPEAMADEPWSATWQRYLDGAAPGAAAAPPTAASRPWAPPADFDAGEGIHPFQLPFRTRSARSAEDLRAEDAVAVADRLYDFLHAVERFDPEAAMACVADDYHELAADRALDRQGFRLWLEELLDGLRGGEIAVSLAEVPRPVRFGRLVLCPATIQVDVAAAPPAVPSALVFRWLLAFERDARGSWRIVTCGRLDGSGDRE